MFGIFKKKINQGQTAGTGATAIQAGGAVSIIHTGLNLQDARTVALDVFRSNFIELSGIAKEIASERAREVTQEFLEKLEKENPNGLNHANNPDFQYSLFIAQREYARSGDKDLSGLLVDLLVDRSKTENRDVLQIVLNESLNTAPKLTLEQVAALAVTFFIRYTQNGGVNNLDSLGAHLDLHIASLAPLITRLKPATTQHLTFASCGTSSAVTMGLEAIYLDVYGGIFSRGFAEEELTKRGIAFNPLLMVNCHNDPTKYQLRARNLDGLNEMLDQNQTPEDQRTLIRELYAPNLMDVEGVRAKLIELRPYMKDILDAWSTLSLGAFQLTSVGIAIGHAELKRRSGTEFADLRIWIN